MANFRKVERYSYLCVDCGIDTWDSGHFYMVEDHVWELARTRNDNEMLCMVCLERRIGRYLKWIDFPIVPLNQHFMNNIQRHLDDKYIQAEERIDANIG